MNIGVLKMLCEYGCGREAIFPPKKGLKKWCCFDNWRKCPAKRTYKKLSESPIMS